MFILVIAALVQFVEMFLKKQMPPLYKALGVYLPLITTNCAVLGVALNSVTKGYNILESVVYGFATAFGFFIAIVLMAGVREKIEYNDIPKPFQGTAIVLLTACLMAIALWDSQEWFLYRIGGKSDMNVTAIIYCSFSCWSCRYNSWIFPRYFRRKIQSRG